MAVSSWITSILKNNQSGKHISYRDFQILAFFLKNVRQPLLNYTPAKLNDYILYSRVAVTWQNRSIDRHAYIKNT